MEPVLSVMDQLVAAVAEEGEGTELAYQLIVFARNVVKSYHIRRDIHAPQLNVQYVKL